jgi:hypothetical protein
MDAHAVWTGLMTYQSLAYIADTSVDFLFGCINSDPINNAYQILMHRLPMNPTTHAFNELRDLHVINNYPANVCQDIKPASGTDVYVLARNTLS